MMLRPSAAPLNATVRIPGSKSITNRALICAALADGRSRLTGMLFADDTQHMIDAIRALDIHVADDVPRCAATVAGCEGQIPATEAKLYCGASGTTLRFCTALCALGFGDYLLDGMERLRERPMADLITAIQTLGTPVQSIDYEGFAPLHVFAQGLGGGEVRFYSPPSSQMISALLLAAPYARADVLIEIHGRRVSEPYIDMTLKVMEAFGVAVVSQVEGEVARYIVAAPQRYQAREYAVEPDASNASYFLAAPALAGGRVTVEGLGTTSIQGDVRFVDVLERMGCRVERSAERLTVHGPPEGQRLRGIDIDLNPMPDTAQTLAVLALFADGPTRIRNVGSLRLKETDRIAALAKELDAMGAEVEIEPNGLVIHPPAKVVSAHIETYDDHRMAMSFALASLRVDGVVIKDPGCVSKTFPDFWEHWRTLV